MGPLRPLPEPLEDVEGRRPAPEDVGGRRVGGPLEGLAPGGGEAEDWVAIIT